MSNFFRFSEHEWIGKAELLCQLCLVKKTEFVIPLQFTGGAFTMYQQLSEKKKKKEKKKDFDAIKETLFTAYGLICSIHAVQGISLVPGRNFGCIFDRFEKDFHAVRWNDRTRS